LAARFVDVLNETRKGNSAIFSTQGNMMPFSNHSKTYQDCVLQKLCAVAASHSGHVQPDYRAGYEISGVHIFLGSEALEKIFAARVEGIEHIHSKGLAETAGTSAKDELTRILKVLNIHRLVNEDCLFFPKFFKGRHP
jgi:hypothetical protein